KGPTLEAGERRLAVETEDHPLEYGGVGGGVPPGGDGRGGPVVLGRGALGPPGGPPPCPRPGWGRVLPPRGEEAWGSAPRGPADTRQEAHLVAHQEARSGGDRPRGDGGGAHVGALRRHHRRAREEAQLKRAMRQDVVIGGFTEPRDSRRPELLVGVYDA